MAVLVLFPPYPELHKDNDPCVFLDHLSQKETNTTFQDLYSQGNTKSHGPREQLATDAQTRLCDVEVFVEDMLEYLEENNRGGIQALGLVRSYAINAWFDRLQSSENQLQDLNIDSFHSSTQDAEESQQNRGVSNNEDKLLNGKGMVNAILRYIASLDLERHRLTIDLRSDGGYDGPFPYMELTQMMGKYTFLRSRMASLLTQAQNLLGVRVTDIQDPVPRHDSINAH